MPPKKQSEGELIWHSKYSAIYCQKYTPTEYTPTDYFFADFAQWVIAIMLI